MSGATESNAIDSNPKVTPSSQLVSWPVAVQCARDRMRGGPAIVFTILLALTGLFAGAMPSAARVFGGLTFAHAFLLALTLLLGTALISEEIDSGHAQLILLRPLSRAAFFGGRLAGAGIVLFGAMLVAWIAACGVALAQKDFSAVYLLALPLAFVWAFSWLAFIGALSSVTRGAGNAVWILVGAVLWGVIKSGLALGGFFATQTHRWPWLETVHTWVNTVLPYIGPQDPTELLTQIAQHASLDFAPLLYDLLWIAASWTAGAYLFSKRELARRRS